MPSCFKIFWLSLPLLIIYFATRTASKEQNIGLHVRKKIFQDAFLWPGLERKGINLKFSENPEDWSDLWSLMKVEGFYSMGQLCVKGAFILYEEPFFRIDRQGAFEVIAGDHTCAQISETTKSIQPVGSMGQIGGPSITFFEKPNFGSEAFPTVINVGSNFFQKMDLTRSAILIGTAPWTIELQNDTKYCIVPEFDPAEPQPLCMIKDFNLLLGSTESDNDNDDDFILRIERATQGCSKDTPEDSIYKIQDCMYWGRHNGSKVGLLIEDDGLAGRSKLDSCSDDEKTKELFLLYKVAITKEFDSNIILGFPSVGKHAWKLELLDWIFGIVESITTDEVISHDFLNKARELFVRQLVTVWNEPGYKDSESLSEDDYMVLMEFTKNCIASVEEQSDVWISKFEDLLVSVLSMSDLTQKIDPVFTRKTELNFISEVAWLAGHMAGYMCQSFYMHQNHYWTLYIHAFWHFYMLPVVPEWIKPQNGLMFYFGGLNHNTEYYKLAMYTTTARTAANKLDPLERPEQLFPDAKAGE